MAIIAAVVVGAVAVVTTAVNIGVGVHAANEQKDMQRKIAKEQKAQRARANFISQQGRAQMPSSMVRTAIKEKVAAIQAEQTGGAAPQQTGGAPAAPSGGTSSGTTVPTEPVATTSPGEGSGGGQPVQAVASSDGSVDPSGMPILATPVGDDGDEDDDDGTATIPTTGSQVDPAVSPNQVNYA